MDHLPEEIISRTFQYLSVSDRKEASLVCRSWYNASLHPMLQRDIIVRCKPLKSNNLPRVGFIRRKLTHLEFGDCDNRQMSEEAIVSLLRECPGLEYLDLSECNSLFLSGRLLSRESDVKTLMHNLVNVRVLKLDRVRHMTDVTFERLVSVMANLEHVSLSSANMIFGSGLFEINQISPAMLHFSTFLKFAQARADKLKNVDLSFTSVHDEAVGSLAKIKNLALDEISLKGCPEISDKGLKLLVGHQHSLKILDISYCKKLGNDSDFFATLANNLPQLHTLKMRKCTKVSQCDVTSLAGIGSLQTLEMGEIPRFFDKDLIKGLCCQGSRLTSLSLPFCPDIGDEFVIQLCKSSYNLIDLDLSSCPRLTDVSLHAITRNLISLQSLRLSCCREISDIGVLGYIPENGVVPRFSFDFDHDSCPCSRERDSKIFRKPTGLINDHKSCMHKAHISINNGDDLHMLSNLQSLRVLDLSYCPRITDHGIAEAVRFKELRSLSLNGLPKINDKAVRSIACHNTSLEDVKLTNNTMISDAAVVELLIHCLQLNSLDLTRCSALTNGCLKAITAYSKKLHHLDLSFNNMTVQAVAALQSYLPKTKIVFKPHIE
uniref:F-box domain-containing protein n=1 Tax=Arion vulgaris TaxID=1028688 RepID=A0A0B6YUU3_9EUPU